MATIANGAQHSLFFVEEYAYADIVQNDGVDTFSFIPLSHTGTTLAVSKDGIMSEKLRGDRQIEEFRHGNKTVGGDITSELEWGSFDALIEAVVCGTWSGSDILKTGTTRRSFTIQRRFNDLDTVEYHNHFGCEFNSMSLSIAPNALVTATFGVVGKSLTIATSQLADYSADTSPTDYVPFDSFTGTVTEGGTAITTVTSLELSIQNGLEPLFSVGSQETSRPSIGKSNVTGTIGLYFDEKTEYEKFLNETESSLSVTLTDLSGNDLKITLPRIKYNSGQPDVSGEGAIIISMDFQALYDDTGGVETNIEFDRTP